MNKKLAFKRILLKISGENFGSEKGGLDFNKIGQIASIIQKIRKDTCVEMAIVVGAGNLFRGRYIENTPVDHVVADQIGMLGTVMNALALQEEIERLGNNTRVMSAIPIHTFCELFIRRRTIRHIEKGRIVILAGGTGNPYFTTDSAAALRATELKCDVLLKAASVDGVYEKDPEKYPDAKKIDFIDYQSALEKGINVMDNTAFALCQGKHMPIIIFQFSLENIKKILRGEKVGTFVGDKPL